jgi:hypothetical protein
MRLAVILLCAATSGSMVLSAKAASGEAAFAFSADPAIGAVAQVAPLRPLSLLNASRLCSRSVPRSLRGLYQPKTVMSLENGAFS